MPRFSDDIQVERLTLLRFSTSICRAAAWKFPRLRSVGLSDVSLEASDAVENTVQHLESFIEQCHQLKKGSVQFKTKDDELMDSCRLKLLKCEKVRRWSNRIRFSVADFMFECLHC